MSNVKEKIAYLQGLKDGLTLKDQDTAKLFNAVIEVFHSIAENFDETEIRLELIDDCIDEIYEDLECLEECDCYDEEYDNLDELLANYYDDEDEYDDDDDDDYEDYEDELEDSDFVSFICPHCEERIRLDISLFKQGIEITCPSCSETVFVAE